MEDLISVQKDSKKTNILNAAIVEFSKGYDEASTLAIIKAAGVSKGLLFHYFGTKKELFLQTYDYAIKLASSEFFELINMENRDVLERIRQITLLKMDLLIKYPGISDFVNNAFYEKNSEIKEEVAAYRNKFVAGLYSKILDGNDQSLFREDIDPKTALEIIIYTIDGFGAKLAKTQKTIDRHYADYGEYVQKLDEYITLFKTCFYR